MAGNGTYALCMWLLFVLFSAVSWSLVSVLDSLLVANYEKHPLVLSWYQSLFSIVVLFLICLFADTKTPWWPLLFAMGSFAYIGDLYFFWVLDTLDVSVTNGAWPILSVFLSIAGFLFFRESWSFLQALAAVLIIGGVLFLSFHHPTGGSLKRTLCILTILAVLYVPTYVVKKAALLAGIPVIAVFFWLLIGREAFSLVIPWCIPTSRRRIIGLIRKGLNVRFLLIGAAVIFSFFSGEFFGALAFKGGPLSLVSVVSNIQPFIVIALAWLTAHLVPSHAPRELISARSVYVKLVSFAVVFVGLALLALPQ